jgi:7,8-dihydroneopterin aldolase/epimerase/oxygenase
MEAGDVGTIALRNIRVLARHGADPGEREREQRFDIDVVATLDLSAAAASDDIAETLHYGRLHERIVRVVRERSHTLIESVAADVLDVVFEDARVRSATVTVSKPELLDGATPSVTLERGRA